MKSCYFKLNINDPCGKLKAIATYGENYYEGQRSQMKLTLVNQGFKPIQKVFISGDEEMFGFDLKELKITLKPQEEYIVSLDIKIPLISEKIKSGEEKKIMKMLIIY